jgi:hypothetical protein
MAAKPGFIPISCFSVDSSFFDGFVDDGKCLRKQFFRFFAIFVCDGRSYGFYACPQNRLVFSVDQVAAQSSSLLLDYRLVLSHFFLLG